MRPQSFLIGAALAFGAFALSGCYTVVKPPFAKVDADERRAYAEQRPTRTPDPRMGDYSSYGENDFYDGYAGAGYDPYGGTSAYGGFPVFGVGYSSPGGGYGYGYGSPYPSYGYGAGSPYGYGYDPYYGGGSGYVPPGYQLVPVSELDRLRTSGSTLANQPTDTVLDQRAIEAQEQKERATWNRRAEPRVRRTNPTPKQSTVQSAPATSTSGSGKTVRAASPTRRSSSSSTAATKSSGKPRKTRR